MTKALVSLGLCDVMGHLPSLVSADVGHMLGGSYATTDHREHTIVAIDGTDRACRSDERMPRRRPLIGSGLTFGGMSVYGAGPINSAERSTRRPGAVSRARRTQRAGTGSDDGRHSRLISP